MLGLFANQTLVLLQPSALVLDRSATIAVLLAIAAHLVPAISRMAAPRSSEEISFEGRTGPGTPGDEPFWATTAPETSVHPKRPAKHHWLGEPLSHQLPNTTRTPSAPAWGSRASFLGGTIGLLTTASKAGRGWHVSQAPACLSFGG